jgi:hypothetical protein
MRRKLVSKTSYIITEISIVVNRVDSFSEAAWLASWFSTFHGTDIQAITQEELLVEGGYRQS